MELTNKSITKEDGISWPDWFSKFQLVRDRFEIPEAYYNWFTPIEIKDAYYDKGMGLIESFNDWLKQFPVNLTWELEIDTEGNIKAVDLR